MGDNFQGFGGTAAQPGGLAYVLVIGFLLLPLLGLAALVLTIIAGIKANEGQTYRYPLCWRLIK